MGDIWSRRIIGSDPAVVDFATEKLLVLQFVCVLEV